MSDVQQIQERVKAVLGRLVEDADLEGSFLRMVAQLEFIGARKILKTWGSRHPNRTVLEHLADEARHAHIFAEMAHQVCPGEQAFCLDAGKAWFQGIDAWVDHTVSEAGGDVEDCYLLTTALVEQRAMRLYPLYAALTAHEAVRTEMKQVLAEEAAHRMPLENAAKARLERLGLSWTVAVDEERRRFLSMLSCWEQTLGLHHGDVEGAAGSHLQGPVEVC